MCNKIVKQSLLTVGLITATLSISPANAETSKNKKARTITVVVDTVDYYTSNETSTILGQIVALQRGEIAAEVKGTIQEIFVSIGDKVKAGTPLAQIDPTRLKLSAEIAHAEETLRSAQIKQAKADAEIAKINLERMERLKSSAAFTQSRYDDLKQQSLRTNAAAIAANANKRIATANRKLAERDLKLTTITAPYAAIVTKRHTHIGAHINEGDSAFTLTDHSSIEIEADVPNTFLSQRHLINQVVDIKFANNKTSKANIRAILPEENPRTRTRTVRFRLQNTKFHRPPPIQSSVEIAFPSQSLNPQLTVAKDAVIQRGGQNVVMVATDKGATMRPVTIGETLGNRFTVIAGLKAGELVVVRGNERLKEGAKLTYTVSKP